MSFHVNHDKGNEFIMIMTIVQRINLDWLNLSFSNMSKFHWIQPSSSHIRLETLSFAEIENLASITLRENLLRQF